MKRLIFFIACCFSLSAFAASPGFDSFNVNQFDVTGKRVALKNGLQVTNLVLFGSSSNLFEIWNQSDELKFYIDTNGVAFPSFWEASGASIVHQPDTVGGRVYLLPSTGTVSDNAKINFQSTTNSSGISQAIQSTAHGVWFQDLYQYEDGTNVIQTLAFYRSGSGVDVLIDPSRDFASVPFLYSTRNTLASGTHFALQNNHTNIFTVDYLGNLTTTGDLAVDDISADNIQATTILIGGNSVSTFAGITNVMTWALSDMTTALTTGTNKNYWYAPAAGMTIKFVRATLATASSSGTPTFDINEAGTSILSTKITIDANEWDSFTAATPPVISDTAIAANAKVDFDIDVAGTAAAGAQIQVGFTVP